MARYKRTDVDIASTLLAESRRLRAVGVDSDRARRRAIGTLKRKIRTEARRSIQREYNLKAKRINDDLTVRASKQAVVLVGRARRIGAIQYQGQWRGRKSAGATVRTDRGGGRDLWDSGGAFIATGLSGNRHIFVRYGQKRRMRRGHYSGLMKQPIHVQYYGSIAAYLSWKPRQQELAEFAHKVLRDEFARLTPKETS